MLIAEEVSWTKRLLLGPVVAAAIGGVSGFVIQWPIALLFVRLDEAGSSGAAPHWDLTYAAFLAVTEGLLFGVFLSIPAYLLFFLPYPPRLIVRVLPLLFLGALLGAIPGVWEPVGALFTVVFAFIASCVVATWRLRTFLAAEKTR